MNSGQASHSVWRKVGIGLGSVRALDSIAIGTFLTILFWSSYGLIGGALLIFAVYAFNLVASVVWLYGIHKKKSRYLLAALTWWIFPLLISLILIISVLSSSSSDETAKQFEQKGVAYHFNDWLKVLVVIGGVLSLLFYAFAVTSYLKLKDAFDGDATEIQGFGVGYTQKNKTTDLNIY